MQGEATAQIKTETKTAATALGGATLAAAAAATAALVARGIWLRGGELRADDLGVAVLAFCIALPLVAMLGLPLFLLLRALRWVRWWSCAAAGVLCAAALVAWARWPEPPQFGDFPVWCAIGAVSALAFWRVARQAR